MAKKKTPKKPSTRLTKLQRLLEDWDYHAEQSDAHYDAAVAFRQAYYDLQGKQANIRVGQTLPVRTLPGALRLMKVTGFCGISAIANREWGIQGVLIKRDGTPTKRERGIVVSPAMKMTRVGGDGGYYAEAWE